MPNQPSDEIELQKILARFGPASKDAVDYEVYLTPIAAAALKSSLLALIARSNQMAVEDAMIGYQARLLKDYEADVQRAAVEELKGILDAAVPLTSPSGAGNLVSWYPTGLWRYVHDRLAALEAMQNEQGEDHAD